MKCLTWGALALLFSVPAFGQTVAPIVIGGPPNAVTVNGGTVPASAPGLATGPTGQLITATPPTNGQASGAVQAADGAGNVRAATPKEIQAAGSDPTHNTEILFGQAAGGSDVCTIPAANQAALCLVAGQISYYNFATAAWTPLIGATASTTSTATVYNILTDTADGNTYASTSAYGGLTIATTTSTGIASVVLTDGSDGNHYSLTSAYGGYRLTPTSTTTGAVSSYSYTDTDGHTYKLGSSYGGLVKTPTS